MTLQTLNVEKEQTVNPSRIPLSFQAVFLASNSGNNVDKPSPESITAKTFFRNWLYFHNNGTTSNGNRIAGGSTRTSKRNHGGTLACSRIFYPPARRFMYKKDKFKNKAFRASSSKKALPELSPQSYLDTLIRSRGYSTIRFRSLHSAYYAKPTPLQQASHNIHLIKLLKDNDVDGFREIMESGISPNPCNSFGESILHMVARRGNFQLFKAMMDAGATVQVADDCGRTPLHDSCWSMDPCFPIVEMILEQDPRLFYIADVRGALPLSYVRKESWPEWIRWLDLNIDVYWPMRNIPVLGEEAAPLLTEMPANTRPVPDPKNALSVDLAQMVSSGRIRPQEAAFLNFDSQDLTSEEWDSSSSFSDSDFDSDYDEDYSTASSSSSLDEEEMAGIISSLAVYENTM